MARLGERVIRLSVFSFVVVTIIYLLAKSASPSAYVAPGVSVPQTTTGTENTNKEPTKDSGNDNDSQKLSSSSQPPQPASYARENATFVSLAVNKDVWELASAIRSVEDRFNHKYHYDWVFLNDEPFDEQFMLVTSSLVSGEAKYGLIPKEHWSYPSWIDQERAAKTREHMSDIIYGGSESYRHMCRYESGFFYRHELMLNYQYYWRVEPSTLLHCDVDYDVFKFMRENNKDYGFTISIHEYESTIQSLWKTTKDFIQENPQYIAENNLAPFITDNNMETYNLCHFWTNFEVGNMNFWRGEAYSKYFEYLDQNGGFFYERWGDAPIHSIAAALFLSRDRIHYFPEIGYFHGPYNNCPIDDKIRLGHKCLCNPNNDFTWQDYSCTRKYYDVKNLEKPAGWKDHTG